MARPQRAGMKATSFLVFAVLLGLARSGAAADLPAGTDGVTISAVSDAGDVIGHFVDGELERNLTPTATMLNYQLAKPGGAILEQPVPGRAAFVETGAIPIFTGHPAMLGRLPHEQHWRGYQTDIAQRANRITKFFNGTLASPLDFLGAHDVRFILWPGVQQTVDAAVFQRMQAQIGSRYRFVRFDAAQPTKGLWERRQ